MVTEKKEIYEKNKAVENMTLENKIVEDKEEAYNEKQGCNCTCNGDSVSNNDKKLHNNGENGCSCDDNTDNESSRSCSCNCEVSGCDSSESCNGNADTCNCGNHSHEEKGYSCGCDGSCESNTDDCGCGTHAHEHSHTHSDTHAHNQGHTHEHNHSHTHTHNHSHAGGERKLDLASVLGIEKKTIGVFTDTHGNLPALEAILPYLKAKKCDEIYHLGDTLCMGAFPKECMERLLKSDDIISVRGNHDNDYLDGITAKRGMSKVPPEHKEYMFAKAGDEFKEIIKDLPYVIVKNYFGLKVAFTHYARYFDEGLGRERFYVIDDNPTPESMDEMFKNVDADIIFMGHKHSPYVVKGKKLYIGIGSLGCHRYEYARGLILHVSPQFYYIEKVQVPYDRNATIDALDERGVPGADVMKGYYFNGQ